jgi:hypothetical protein
VAFLMSLAVVVAILARGTVKRATTLLSYFVGPIVFVGGIYAAGLFGWFVHSLVT